MSRLYLSSSGTLPMVLSASRQPRARTLSLPTDSGLFTPPPTSYLYVTAPPPFRHRFTSFPSPFQTSAANRGCLRRYLDLSRFLPAFSYLRSPPASCVCICVFVCVLRPHQYPHSPSSSKPAFPPLLAADPTSAGPITRHQLRDPIPSPFFHPSRLFSSAVGSFYFPKSTSPFLHPSPRDSALSPPSSHHHHRCLPQSLQSLL